MAKHMKEKLPKPEKPQKGKKAEGMFVEQTDERAGEDAVEGAGEIVRIFDEERPSQRGKPPLPEQDSVGEGRTIVFSTIGKSAEAPPPPPTKTQKPVRTPGKKQKQEEPEPLFEPEAAFEYEDDEDAEEDEARLRRIRIPRIVYRVGCILLVLVLGLVWWLNRDSLTLQGISNWVRLQFVGSGQGDGFPVAMTGSVVDPSNFTAYNGDAIILSDTALTMIDPTGKTQLSLRHSLNQPALRSAYGKTLLYNVGSAGYTVLSGTEVRLSGASEKDILTGAVTQNGRFALGVQGSDGASELNVFLENGNLQYHYLFARDYITAIALNYDGTYGAICTISAEKGKLISKVTVCDFNETKPVAVYESRDNLLLGAMWTEGGELYVVGDSALLTARSSSYEFQEYSYEGRQLTAFQLSQGRAFLSLSYYEHAGPCTLLVYKGKEQPVRVESEERIVSLSVSGGTVGALSGSTVRFYDWSTGEELGKEDAGADAKSIALSSERTAYVLGVSEIRTLQLQP